MGAMVEFRVLELLNARLCHELVSPVGAINNGVELLDEDDPDFVREAVQLIGQSARKAGQRLQFYRFAYGTSASGAGQAAGSGRELSEGLLEGGKIKCEWHSEAASLPLDWQRLACNMLVLAADTLPRGGGIVVRSLRTGQSGIEVTAEAEGVNVTAELRAALSPSASVDQLTSRTIQAYFTSLVAGQLGAVLTLAEADSKRAVFRAQPS